MNNEEIEQQLKKIWIEISNIKRNSNFQLKFPLDTGSEKVIDGVISKLIKSGYGSPEGVVTAEVGKIYLRQDGTATSIIYVKGSGSGNTGWTAK
jgi:hypothetical protein